LPTINGDRDAALDLVQDAFAKIWEHCSQIEFSKDLFIYHGKQPIFKHYQTPKWFWPMPKKHPT
jgi:hypothetical protein